MRWIAAKVLELLGACVLVFSLLNGLGLNSGAEPSLPREIFLFVIGSLLLFIGVMIDRTRATQISSMMQHVEEVSK